MLIYTLGNSVDTNMTRSLRTGKHQTEWITISVDEYKSMCRTIEVLSDPDLMQQIEEGKKKGTKVQDFEEVARELGI
jgi:PHD/YefM family antitoxin component YafN of YafNO toxin-antitoxin module